MSGPSEKAIEAAKAHSSTWSGCTTAVIVERIGRALHDPALGLDRSVCLRDVVEWAWHYGVDPQHRLATAIEREFGGGS